MLDIGAIITERAEGWHLVLGSPLRHGIGFGLNSPAMPLGPNPRTCFWGGWGGSAVLIDLDAHVVTASAMNKMKAAFGDARTASLTIAVYQSLAEGGA